MYRIYLIRSYFLRSNYFFVWKNGAIDFHECFYLRGYPTWAYPAQKIYRQNRWNFMMANTFFIDWAGCFYSTINCHQSALPALQAEITASFWPVWPGVLHHHALLHCSSAPRLLSQGADELLPAMLALSCPQDLDREQQTRKCSYCGLRALASALVCQVMKFWYYELD